MRREVTAARTLAQGDLILVVRKNQVDPAGVKIKILAEIFLDHRRALEVPARATLAPRGGPEILAVFRLAAFPKDEVREAVLFVFIGVRPRVLCLAKLEFALVKARQLSVARKRRDLEIHRAVVRRVGVTLFHQRGDHRNLLRDVIDRAGLDMRRQQAEGIAIGMELLRPTTCEVLQRLSRRLRVADGLVIHVGDVPDMEGPRAAGLQRAAKDILQHEGAEVPDVGGAVHGGSTAVEPVGRAVEGAELLELAGQRVVKPHRSGV
jgi:hypothetical protein